jgi:hypothetical protein
MLCRRFFAISHKTEKNQDDVTTTNARFPHNRTSIHQIVSFTGKISWQLLQAFLGEAIIGTVYQPFFEKQSL